MKTTYIFIGIVVLVVAATAAFFALYGLPQQEEVIPEGYHRMSDGTLMRNDVGTEGMGALSEIQEDDSFMEADVDANIDIAIDPNAKVFEVRGVNYAFDVSEIRVKKGDTVTINFESTDGFHDWVVDEFDARTQRVQPGTKTSVTFVADETGTFEFYCSVGQHRSQGMVGSLIVEA